MNSNAKSWRSPFGALPGERSVLVQDSILDLLDVPECVRTVTELLGVRAGSRLQLFAPISGLPGPPVCVNDTKCYEAEVKPDGSADFGSLSGHPDGLGEMIWANKMLKANSNARIVAIGSEINALVGEESYVDQVVSARPQVFVDYANEWLDSQNFLGKSIGYRVIYSPELRRLVRSKSEHDSNQVRMHISRGDRLRVRRKSDFQKIFESMYPEH